MLDLSGMTVLDLPDSGLKEMDPREIEQAVIYEIERTRPDVIVTFPVHGISGFQSCETTVGVLHSHFSCSYPGLLVYGGRVH